MASSLDFKGLKQNIDLTQYAAYLGYKIDKKKSNKLWENAVLSMISPNNKYVGILNGVRIKIKEKFDEIEIWMSSQAASKDKLEQLKSYLKDNLQVTDEKAYNFFPFK